ncbi:MAG: hypothetical protein K2X27_02950 [Candidatus Obscuribacterales bacterium]|nr:hypothetical protein [Candidatus Obscuribacterales bacterium]
MNILFLIAFEFCAYQFHLWWFDFVLGSTVRNKPVGNMLVPLLIYLLLWLIASGSLFCFLVMVDAVNLLSVYLAFVLGFIFKSWRRCLAGNGG